MFQFHEKEIFGYKTKYFIDMIRNKPFVIVEIYHNRFIFKLSKNQFKKYMKKDRLPFKLNIENLLSFSLKSGKFLNKKFSNFYIQNNKTLIYLKVLRNIRKENILGNKILSDIILKDICEM